MKSASTYCNFSDWRSSLAIIELFTPAEVGSAEDVDKVWIGTLGWWNWCPLKAFGGVKLHRVWLLCSSRSCLTMLQAVVRKCNLTFKRFRFFWEFDRRISVFLLCRLRDRRNNCCSEGIFGFQTIGVSDCFYDITASRNEKPGFLLRLLLRVNNWSRLRIRARRELSRGSRLVLQMLWDR